MDICIPLQPGEGLYRQVSYIEIPAFFNKEKATTMKIQQLDLTILDLAAGYHDDGDGGVFGYGGPLDIRRRTGA